MTDKYSKFSRVTAVTKLIFKGGSVKGIAYVGALETVKREFDFETITKFVE